MVREKEIVREKHPFRGGALDRSFLVRILHIEKAR